MEIPTIVIVPGACQPPSLYHSFASALTSGSFPSTIVPTPSVGASPSLKDFTADVELVRNTVTELVNDGKDVIVLMHSYGGIPGSAALKGLGKKEKVAEGKTGGVTRLIYMCSIVVREGEKEVGADDLEKMGQFPGFDKEAMTFTISPSAAQQMLFHDLPEPAQEECAAQLKPHSVGALWSRQNYAASKDIPSTYVLCTLDRVVLPERQKEMVENAKEMQPKAFDVVERLESGHEPQLSRTEEMVAVVKRASEAAGW